jgi:hypothetical protein
VQFLPCIFLLLGKKKFEKWLGEFLAIITADLIAKIAKYMRYYLLNILPLNFV